MARNSINAQNDSWQSGELAKVKMIRFADHQWKKLVVVNELFLSPTAGMPMTISKKPFIRATQIVALDSSDCREKLPCVMGQRVRGRGRPHTARYSSPGIFIPVAEKTGFIGKLSHWVLWTACQQPSSNESRDCEGLGEKYRRCS